MSVACSADMASIFTLSEAVPRSSGASRCPRLDKPFCASTNHFQKVAGRTVQTSELNRAQVGQVQECTDGQSETSSKTLICSAS